MQNVRILNPEELVHAAEEGRRTTDPPGVGIIEAIVTALVDPSTDLGAGRKAGIQLY